MTATTEIKKPAINSCKGHSRTSIVANSCWRWHQAGLRQLEFWTGNGKRWIAMESLEGWCAVNNMIICGTLFLHRNVHRFASTSTNGWDQTQVDRLMVSSAGAAGRSLLGVRVRRRTDGSSVHHLVTAKVGLKLRAAKPNKHTTPSYDFSRPQESGTRNAFVLQLRNMFQASSNIEERDNEEVDTANQQCKQVVQCSGTISPMRQRPHNRLRISNINLPPRLPCLQLDRTDSMQYNMHIDVFILN